MFGMLFKQLLVYAIVFGGAGFFLFKTGKKKDNPLMKYAGIALCGMAGMMCLSGLVTGLNAALFW